MTSTLIAVGFVAVIGPSAAAAATVSGSYQGAAASITAPDTVVAGEPFEVSVSGVLTNPGFIRAIAYDVYENAQWSYDSQHLSVVSSGTWLDGHPLVFSGSLDRSYSLVRSPGTYRYTFVFGDRGAHLGYDIVVETVVEVVEPGPSLCGLVWRPPKLTKIKVGSTLPLKFFAADCETGLMYEDPDVVLEVSEANGPIVAVYSDIRIGNRQYQYNWSTRGIQKGDYVVTARFSTGDELTRAVQIR